MAHGALAYVLASLEWEDAPVREFAPIDMSITVAPEPPPQEPPPQESPPAEASEPVVVQPARRSRPSAPAPIEPAPSEPMPSAPATPPVEAPSFALPSARAVALSTFELGGALDAGVERPRGPVREADALALENALMEAVRKVDTAPDPELHPAPGGGYTFRGNGFSARIDTDGSVHMADNFRDAKFIFRRSAGEDGLAAGFKFFSTKFDIFKRIDRALGNDPFQSERRWFLDRTRDLRESMAAHYLDQRVHSRRDE